MDIIITAIGDGDAYYPDRRYFIGKRATTERLRRDGKWYFGEVTFEEDPLSVGIPMPTYRFAQIKYKEVP